MPQNFKEVHVRRVLGLRETGDEHDALAVEEPLEIRVAFAGANGRQIQKSISITMRTPGDDLDLAAGFLFTEGIIRSPADISRIKHCGIRGRDSVYDNTVRVDLAAGVGVDLKRLERHFYTSSSCGVCGKTSIDALDTGACALADDGSAVFDAELVHTLPGRLRLRQETFDRTGGLHAAAFFDSSGAMDDLREDVGRHNAVDKLIGSRFLAGAVPASDRLMLVSGRASFELVQKALMAGVPAMAAVGAPSSLAAALAEKFGMTLLGFVRDGRFNIYTGAHRIRLAAASGVPCR